MPKLLVLLLLIDQGSFIVGVETAGGLVSRSFQNSTQGAKEFFEFAGPITEREGGRYNICLVPAGDGDFGAVWDALESEKIAYATIPPARYTKFVSDKSLELRNIHTAANACADILKIFGRKSF